MLQALSLLPKALTQLPSQVTQAFPPSAKFTENQCLDQAGKVFIVTGSSSGVGKELAQLLYSKSAKVYVADRNEVKAQTAISDITAKFPNSKGALVFLKLDLDDLTTIKKSVEEFRSKEDRLDVLWNNAGVMTPPQGSKTKQGYELQLGTNNVAPFLFTKLLTPTLMHTAKTAPPSSVRVVWVSSMVAEVASPKGGVDMDNLDYKKDQIAEIKYGISKAGNALHAMEYAKRHRADGIVSVALNPGNLNTELTRHLPGPVASAMKVFLHKPIQGAYTELFAGLSPDIGIDQTGCWVIPWGRINPIRSDIKASSLTPEEGGTGVGAKFWEWSEEQVKPFL